MTHLRHASLLLALALLSVACALGQSDPGGQLPTVTPASVDPCNALGTVLAEFDLPQGMDFWDVFPDAGLAPELEGRSGLQLIVYDGPVELTNVSGIPGIPRETSVTDAVCVVRPNGDASLYYDIPRARMNLPIPRLPPTP